MLLRMHRGFFPFQTQPKSKWDFLRFPQILSFNSLIYTTTTEAKRIPDACLLQSSTAGEVREGQVRTPSAGAAPRVRGASTSRGNRPPGPQPAPHHDDPSRPRPLPARPSRFQPAPSGGRRPRRRHWAAALATQRRHRAPTQRHRAGRERCEPGSTSTARISVVTRGQ